MIPTIEEIVAAVAADRMAEREAVRFLHDHMDLERGDLREMFAAQAMQGMVANQVDDSAIPDRAFALADAMLEARKK